MKPESEALIAGLDPTVVRRVLLWAVDTLCASETPSPATLNRMAASGVTARDLYTLGHAAALVELSMLAKSKLPGAAP